MVSGIEGDPDLTVVVAPICVVGAPVKGRDIHSTIVLNQLLFNKVVSIELGIAKPGAGNSQKLGVRKGAK